MKLEIKNLSFKYTKKSPNILNDVSIQFEQGGFWCVLGPNGSGKSTLLKLVTGLIPFESTVGEVLWDGRALIDWTKEALARKVAFLPGGLRLDYPVTVYDFVLQGRYAHGKFWSRASKNDYDLVDKFLSRLRLESVQKHLMSEISSGQVQLAIIARALVQDPDVFIFDETTSNLDLNFQYQVAEILKDLHQKNKTIIFVTHDLNVGTEFCPNLVFLKNGSIKRVGSTEEVLDNDIMHELYSEKVHLAVGKNPFTNKPKVFFT